jgi:hypothetical protein
MANAYDEMQGLHNLKQIFGGSEIEQRKPIKNIERTTPPPYGTNYMSGDYGKSKNPMSLEEADSRLNDAYKMQQMKQLEDLEQIGEFEEPDSEANLRAAKLRALLGK